MQDIPDILKSDRLNDGSNNKAKAFFIEVNEQLKNDR